MKRPILLLTLLSLAAMPWFLTHEEHAGAAAPSAETTRSGAPEAFTGSAVCTECHESFHQLWSTSHHGLAMQPYTDKFSAGNLIAQEEPVSVGDSTYLMKVGPGEGYMLAKEPSGEKKYPILHVMGGKNVYFFLTELERGRLQTLPVAFDVNTFKWYDMAGNAVRHFMHLQDEALDWRDRPYTFNTSCYGCHVSQLSTNYSLEADTYHTVWAEPGINCETCHGPGGEHIKVCREAGEGNVPEDLKLIVTSKFTPSQTNTMCAPCHAKMSPITQSFQSGDRFFDHYDLVTFEDHDFYPDGRDLGENYTYTGWMMNPCAKEGELDCMHCHTSSGRYRFTEENANDACMPCHESRVKNATKHTHHAADSKGNRCVSCHMPMTGFARMRRSDHSVRPPTPAATIAFESPNACNICHDDKDAAWADMHVREWHKDDYQAPVIALGKLIEEARLEKWERLPEMLEYIAKPGRDEVFATSFIRLLRACDDERIAPVLIEALKDSSPLVRASAAESLAAYLTPASVAALLDCTSDSYRLVRIRAAYALARVPEEDIAGEKRESLAKATAELDTSLRSRPDDSFAHYNLGNFLMSKGNYQEALESYEVSARLDDQNFLPLVNASLIYNMMGDNSKAESSLRKVIEIEPKSEAGYLNLALLMAEESRLDDAEKAFRKVMELNPRSEVASYNLGVLLLGKESAEAVQWCRTAHELRPDDPKYAYTLAYCLMQEEDTNGAIETLRGMIDKKMAYGPAYTLLGHLLEQNGDIAGAIAVYKKGMDNKELGEQDYYSLAMSIGRLQGN